MSYIDRPITGSFLHRSRYSYCHAWAPSIQEGGCATNLQRQRKLYAPQIAREILNQNRPSDMEIRIWNKVTTLGMFSKQELERARNFV